MSEKQNKMTAINKALLVIFIFLFILALTGGIVSLMSIKRDISVNAENEKSLQYSAKRCMSTKSMRVKLKMSHMQI